MKDNNHIYLAGAEYPREGVEASKKRVAELASTNNKRGEVLIKAVEETEEVIKEVEEAVEQPEEVAQEAEDTVEIPAEATQETEEAVEGPQEAEIEPVEEEKAENGELTVEAEKKPKKAKSKKE